MRNTALNRKTHRDSASMKLKWNINIKKEHNHNIIPSTIRIKVNWFHFIYIFSLARLKSHIYLHTFTTAFIFHISMLLLIRYSYTNIIFCTKVWIGAGVSDTLYTYTGHPMRFSNTKAIRKSNKFWITSDVYF